MTDKLIAFLAFLLITYQANAQKIHLLYEEGCPQTAYAAKVIQDELEAGGAVSISKRESYDFLINLDKDPNQLPPEAYEVTREGKVITVKGGDSRGLIYGAFALTEQLRAGVSWGNVDQMAERPHFPLRAIKHNTPWYTYRSSSALDIHMETTKDIKYWEAFLDMMAENRFNSLSLWNLHPFVYMIKPKNFPEASPFTDRELAEWIKLHQEILKLAHERAIDTYLVPFNIFVSEEFSKAHGVAASNFYPHYYVNGDTSELVKRYMRESITQVLEEYPTLTGIGLTLGEGMAGMTPSQREQWMKETYIAGIKNAGRKVKLVHRIPFSSTTESLGATSVELEQLTRKSIEEEGKLDFIDGPIWADLKYNWSHTHSTPKLIKVHGGEMFDTFYNPEPESYKITYTARNEDFFALRWGVPQFIRDHISENSHSYVGGYFIGSETYIPALDYFTAIDEPVDWDYAFERQWLFYKLWGRLLYNPSTDDDVFRQAYREQYGPEAGVLLQAMSLASSTQLRLNSFYDTRWDFTLYGEGFMALIGDETRYISVDRLIEHPPLDPAYISIKEFVDGKIKGVVFGESRITPKQLADDLERDCKQALGIVLKIGEADNASLMYEMADIKAWAYLGLHFSEKLKGAIALEFYRQTKDKEQQKEAVEYLRSALEQWDELVRLTRPIYNDMPLTHYNGSSHDRNDDNIFHWEYLREDVLSDIEKASEDI